ncbi:ABC transporter ATP-binding protein [Actinomycetospora sp. OC33-EN08]|uniref:ABC transporter ATP-binding protein n=1 Tax=Actinomycetospora aurantiaca TaxID=3129233 RepID=A0ABU8MVK7_9PSEU
MVSRLRAERATLGYGGRTVAEDLTVDVPEGAFTAVVGPNACGKSTLLRALVRQLDPSSGTVTLDGRPVGVWKARAFARAVAFLPQDPVAPEGETVRRLVGRGRFPHQRPWALWSPADAEAVEGALVAAGVSELADRGVAELSGGQRQRVWIAMVLAQETSHLLLDEPTSFLDLRHQYEVLSLLARLRDEGRTVVAVLHDVNQAARYADHVIALRDGAVVAAGPPGEVIDAALVERVFDLPALVVPDPVTGTPMVVPRV